MRSSKAYCFGQNTCRMPLFKLSKFIVVPILSEWLKFDSFLACDTALCSTIHRPNFLALMKDYPERFERTVSASVRIVLSIGFIRWMQYRGLSFAAVQECCLLPSLARELVNHPEMSERMLRAIESLTIPYCFEQTSVLFQLPFHARLRKISIASPVTDDILTVIASNCPLLKSFSFAFKSQHDGFTRLCMQCTELEELRLTGTVYPTTLACILVYSRRLQFFCADHYVHSRFIELFLVHFQGEVRWIKTSWMGGRKMTKKFHFLQNSRVTRVNTATLSLWSTVKDFCPNITELDVSFILDLNYIVKDLPSLRVFTHSGVRPLDRDSLLALSTHCRELRNVTMIDFQPIAVADWIFFFESLPHLTHFAVSNVRADDDTAEICAAINRLPSLAYLSITLHSIISDDLAVLCPLLYKVTTLKLNECRITDVGIWKLINSVSSSLIEFSAVSCPLISDLGVACLLKSCGKILRSLTLKSCKGISDSCLEICTVYGGALRVLDVSGCEKISFEEVAVVAQLMTRLKKLTSSFIEKEIRPCAHEDLILKKS